MPDKEPATGVPGAPLYLLISALPVAASGDVGAGAVFIDRDETGAVVGVEILDPDLAAAIRQAVSGAG